MSGIHSNECLGAALAELAKAGIRDPVVARGSKHWQVRWAGRGGQPRMVTVPCTPGDVRAVENMRRDVRGVLRTDGMLPVDGERAAMPARLPSRIELLERRVAEVERRLTALASTTTRS